MVVEPYALAGNDSRVEVNIATDIDESRFIAAVVDDYVPQCLATHDRSTLKRIA
jgi:hypothetical protein